MKDVVIFGLTDFAEVAHAYLSEPDSGFRVAAFTAHGAYIDRPAILGTPVVPFETLDKTHPPERHEVFVAIGFKRLNGLRTEMYELCKQNGYTMLRYVHPRSVVASSAKIGDNCFVFEHNTIQPFVTIGNNVIVWSGNHIGHHSTIGDNCFIASHAVISGHCEIGEGCFIGVNTTLRDGIKVAPRCLIGAGALILKDTIEAGVYKGVATGPAEFKSHELRNF